MFKIFILLCLLFFIPNTYAQFNSDTETVYMFGDSITLNMLNYPDIFDNDYYNVTNYGRSACGIELLTNIIDPNRDLVRLNTLIQENGYIIGLPINEIIIPDMSITKPGVVSILVGFYDMLTSNSLVAMSRYNILLNKLEELLAPNTIVLLQSVIPMDNEIDPITVNIIINIFRDFNLKLEEEVNRRLALESNSLKYIFVDLHSEFLKDGTPNRSLYLR